MNNRGIIMEGNLIDFFQALKEKEK